jgi:hypothetical protein
MMIIFLRRKQMGKRIILVGIVVLALCGTAAAEEAESLMGEGAELGFIWALEAKGYSIQDKAAVGYGAHFSLLFKNISTSFGWAGVLNISHPDVNFGYMGLLSQYTYRPNSLFHFSGQLLVGFGSTKDYQQPKSSPFDNFANITGPGFFIVEPGINGEMNLHAKVRLVAGVGYRVVVGVDSSDPLVSITNVDDRDLSGLSINLGVKFGAY